MNRRKPTRLKGYDYSLPNAYFVTICADKRKTLFSKIVGEGLAPPEIVYKPCGRVLEEQILRISTRFPCVTVDEYVIMPNHIHLLLSLVNQEGGASPSPTVTDVVCALKSIVSRICKQNYGIEKIFQRSFYDHVIRGRQDYENLFKYILENPYKWEKDELYSKE